ncbi:hypothetical protein FSP39_021790, partial [Pinctada imbricata]
LIQRKMISQCVRIVLFTVFIFSTFSVTINIYSVGSFLAFIVSVFLLRGNKQYKDDSKEKSEPTTRQILNSLYPLVDRNDLERKVDETVRNYVTYDATDTQSVRHFRQIQERTECIFAKRAKVWGNMDWNSDISLDDELSRCCATFLQFTIVCRQSKLDGFVFEIPTTNYAEDVQKFGNTVRRVLKTLSDHDPRQYHCMNKSYVGKTGWVFEFNKVTFFITTFASFYPESNSRYSFGCENSFILLQPELSFALHDLSPDTPETNFEHPVTERDRIRKCYRDAGRGYRIPKDIRQPMAWDIVKPVNECDDIVEWWK